MTALGDDATRIMQLNHALETKVFDVGERVPVIPALSAAFLPIAICHQGLEVHLCASAVIKVCFCFLVATHCMGIDPFFFFSCVYG